MQLPFPTDPLEFVVWLMLPASAGVIVSLLLERAGWFQAMKAKSKHYTVLATFLLLPVAGTLAAYALGVGGVVLPAEPRGLALWLFGIVFQGLSAWAASQYAHKYDPEKERVKRLHGPL